MKVMGTWLGLRAAGVVFAAVVLMAASAPGASARSRCDICSSAIAGEYYQTEESPVRTFCDRCYTRYPHCPGCGSPVRASASFYRDQKVCSNCVRRVGRCAACADVLLGKFYKADGAARPERFCESCYQTGPRCALCDLPFQGMYPCDGRHVCIHCLKAAKRCATCRQPILNTFYTIDFVEGTFCRKCFQERPHCDFCNKPILTGGRELEDGRRSCATCAAAAVSTMREATDLLGETVRYLQTELGMTLQSTFDLVLVDSREMAVLTGNTSSYSSERRRGEGVLRELGLFSSRPTPENPRPVIAILSDLPRTAFLETAAHECAHLWQHERNPWLKDKQTVEGFAQWVAAKWLLRQGLESAHARLESNDDPVYGSGFHKIRAREDRADAAAVFDYVRDHQRDGRKPPAPPSPASPKPLSRVLPGRYLTGDYAFFRTAVVVEPRLLRRRLAAAAP